MPTFSLRARGGVCTTCGSSKKIERGVFATRVEAPDGWDMEICGRCIAEAAERLGMVDRSAVDEIQAEFDILKEWADEAYAELESRDATITTLSGALARTAGERDALTSRIA